jgi:tRNA-specific 2-thiouridylase
MKRVVVGLSGGVDSSVCAALLKEQGYDVVGIFMRNWHDETVVINNECPWIEDSNDALLVAEKLEIPFQVLDLSADYKSRIVDYMFAEYEAGRTPNPDVLCNREIKFDVFLKAAEQLGADYVATGHYCQKDTIEVEGKEVHRLLAGADKNKDQSYFLCQVSQEQLAKALFPIGALQKSEVRKIAEKYDLVTANKKDSQGLCFVGKISLPEFLQQKLKAKQGKVIEIAGDNPIYAERIAQESKLSGNDLLELQSTKIEYKLSDGIVKGEHIGAHFFTIGQRKGLGIGGTPLPLFVLATDVENNIVYTGQGDNHLGLVQHSLKLHPKEISWLRADLKVNEGEQLEVMARIRYRQTLCKATVHNVKGTIYLHFTEAQKSVTAGQFAAWYINEELVGSGVIS